MEAIRILIYKFDCGIKKKHTSVAVDFKNDTIIEQILLILEKWSCVGSRCPSYSVASVSWCCHFYLTAI